MSKSLWKWSLATVLLAPALVLAQQPGQRDPDSAPPRTADRAATQGEARTADRTADAASQQARPASQQTQQFMLQCLINGNQKEIAMARLAQEKASSREVKDFAEMMIKDHTQFVSQLEQFQRGGRAASGQSNRATEGGATDRNQTAPSSQPFQRQADPSTPRKTETAAASGQQGALGELAQIEQELAQRCLASSRKFLEQKQGAEFDMAYMGSQITAHMAMLDSLNTYRNHVSPELAQVLAKGVQTTQQHFNHAHKIVQDLGKNQTGTARRDSDSTRERRQ